MISIKEINKLAIPAILFNITEPLIGLADTALIGQIDYQATLAQGGVGLSSGLIATLVWGLAQMRTSLSAIVSRHFGSNHLDKIKSLIPQTFLMTLILGSLIGALLIFYFDEVAIFLFGDIEENTLKYAQDYFKIRAIYESIDASTDPLVPKITGNEFNPSFESPSTLLKSLITAIPSPERL